MQIANAQITLAATQDYQAQDLAENFNLNIAATQAPTMSEITVAPPKPQTIYISTTGTLLAKYRVEQRLDLNTSLDSKSRVNLMVLKAMLESITGQPININEPSELNHPDQGTDAESDQTLTPISVQPINVQITPPNRSVTTQMVYEHRQHLERETTNFTAEGVITTRDGKQINFSVALNMKREFAEETFAFSQLTETQKIDPLVINFDGLGAELSQTRFAFDLDNDGTSEQIASLHPNSGYLALDRNGDGVINNGSELFGPSSGKGFAELAAFDEDGNQFIDEGDSIYKQLRIWITNDDGSSQLVALGDKQIGAIYLGHVTSPFQLKDGNNSSLGEIKNSGIYINENGSVGMVQEIDLHV